MARKSPIRSHGAALQRVQRRRQGVTVAVSFLLAVTLWFLVSLNVRTFESQVQLPVQVTHIPKELNLREPSPPDMLVTVKGKGIPLLYQGLRKHPDTVQIDFRSYQETGSFDAGAHLEVINLSLEKGLQAISCSPNEVRLAHYEKETRRVPVSLKLDYKLMESLQLSSPLRYNPDTVLVVGPSELLDTLRFWAMPRVTVPGTIRADTNLYLPLAARAPFEVVQKEIMVSFDVDAYTEVVQELPISWKNLPEGMVAQLNCERVKVHCIVPLHRYEELRDYPLMLSVDYRDLKADSKLLFPRVENLPEGIELQRISPSWVECVITEL